MPKYVYLAGPITGLSYDECTDWRTEAHRMFRDRGDGTIDTLSPMRGKDYLQGMKSIPASIDPKDLDTNNVFTAFSNPTGLVRRDFNDVKNSDLLLVNLLGATRVSLGTVAEMAWAYLLQTPVVVIMEPSGNPHDGHDFITEFTGYRITNVSDGVDIARLILGEYSGVSSVSRE